MNVGYNALFFVSYSASEHIENIAKVQSFMVLKGCVKSGCNCLLVILVTCHAVARVFSEKDGLAQLPLFSLSLFSSIFFNHGTVKQSASPDDERQQGHDILAALPFSSDPESLAILKTRLIPEDLPDWQLQYLYQQWQLINASHSSPEEALSSRPKPGIYLSLVNQQFRMALLPVYGFSAWTQELLAERCLNTLLHYLMALLDTCKIPVTSDDARSSTATGGDDGDDDPRYPSHNNKFDVFVYQPEAGWNPLFWQLDRQQLLKASIQQKRRLLVYLQQKIRRAINNGHEQLARILRDRVMVTEVSLDELLNQIIYPGTGLYSDEYAPVMPLLQNLSSEEMTLNEEYQSIMTPSSPRDEGGKGREENKETTSQKTSEKGKRRREGNADQGQPPPPAKKGKQQASGDEGGSQQEEMINDLSLEQRYGDLHRWLQLDIAWEFKDNIDLLRQICKQPGTGRSSDSNYLQAFRLLHRCISDRKIESVLQLSEMFSSGGREILERFNKVIREYRKEYDDIPGEYSELHSFLMKKQERPKTCFIQESFILGLHLGLPVVDLQRKRLEVFRLYNKTHPGMPLASFFPLFRKGMSRMGNEDLYRQIYSAYINRFSEQGHRKPVTAGKKMFIRRYEHAQPVVIEGFSKTDGMQLFLLPYDVWLRIFCFVDLESLCRSRQVCRFFCGIVDDPRLHVIGREFNGYIKSNHGVVQTRDEVQASFWFHFTDNWIKVLEENTRKDKEKTSQEMIRHCMLDCRLLEGYLRQEIGLVKLSSPGAVEPGHSVYQIQTDCPRHEASPSPSSSPSSSHSFMVAVAAGRRLSYFRCDKGKIKELCRIKTALEQTKVAILNIDRLFVALERYRGLHLWDGGNKKKSALQLIRNVLSMTVMTRHETPVLITHSYSQNRNCIEVHNICKAGASPELICIQQIPVALRINRFLTMNDQTKLIVDHSKGHASLWGFNQDRKLCNLLQPGKLPGLLDTMYVKFPGECFDDCFCGIAFDPDDEQNGHLFGWNSDLVHQFTFASPKLYNCSGLEFLDKNTLVTANPWSVTLWQNQVDGWNELKSFQIFTDEPETFIIRNHPQARRVFINSLKVVDECRILLGDSSGRIALYFIP